MNFSASRNFHSAFTRRLSKLLQLHHSHPRVLISAYQHQRFYKGEGGGLSTFEGGGGGMVKNSALFWKSDQFVSRNIVDVCNDRISAFHTTSVDRHGEYEWQDPKSEEEIVQVHFVDKEGKDVTIRGKIGDNLLYLSKRFEVEMEGACEASLACTTCHVYVNDEFLDLLPEATETEEDLLDQAPFLKSNSRLGCQIILNKQLDGIKLALPAVTKNFYVDGHKPTPH